MIHKSGSTQGKPSRTPARSESTARRFTECRHSPSALKVGVQGFLAGNRPHFREGLAPSSLRVIGVSRSLLGLADIR